MLKTDDDVPCVAFETLHPAVQRQIRSLARSTPPSTPAVGAIAERIRAGEFDPMRHPDARPGNPDELRRYLRFQIKAYNDAGLLLSGQDRCDVARRARSQARFPLPSFPGAGEDELAFLVDWCAWAVDTLDYISDHLRRQRQRQDVVTEERMRRLDADRFGRREAIVLAVARVDETAGHVVDRHLNRWKCRLHRLNRWYRQTPDADDAQHHRFTEAHDIVIRAIAHETGEIYRRWCHRPATIAAFRARLMAEEAWTIQPSTGAAPSDVIDDLFTAAVSLRERCPQLPAVPSTRESSERVYLQQLKQWCIDSSALEAAGPDHGVMSTGLTPTNCLSDPERAVLDLLRELKPGNALTGKEIVADMNARRQWISQSTLTSRIIPGLKRAGISIKNRRGVGYFILR